MSLFVPGLMLLLVGGVGFTLVMVPVAAPKTPTISSTRGSSNGCMRDG
jgi:hypothetical protein